jgi:hypothetical protein
MYPAHSVCRRQRHTDHASMVPGAGYESDIHMHVPSEFEANASSLSQMLKKGHYDVELSRDDWERLYTWIDFNVPYRPTGSNTNAQSAAFDPKHHSGYIEGRGKDRTNPALEIHRNGRRPAECLISVKENKTFAPPKWRPPHSLRFFTSD